MALALLAIFRILCSVIVLSSRIYSALCEWTNLRAILGKASKKQFQQLHICTRICRYVWASATPKLANRKFLHFFFLAARFCFQFTSFSNNRKESYNVMFGRISLIRSDIKCSMYIQYGYYMILVQILIQEEGKDIKNNTSGSESQIRMKRCRNTVGPTIAFSFFFFFPLCCFFSKC